MILKGMNGQMPRYGSRTSRSRPHFGTPISEIFPKEGRLIDDVLPVEEGLCRYGRRAIVRYRSKNNGKRNQAPQQLEDENGKLKRLVADLSLDMDMPQIVLQKVVRPSARRAVAVWFEVTFRVFRVSERYTIQTGDFDLSSYRYRSSRDPETPLRERLKELAAAGVRYVHRRLHALLRREGWAVNHKRTYRLDSSEGLPFRTRTPYRRRTC